MYTVVIERKIGDTQFVTFTGRIAAQNMVDRAKQNSNVISAVIRDDAPRTTQQHNRETCDLGVSCERCYPKTQLPRKTQAELIRAYWPVLTVEERVQFLTNAAPETEHACTQARAFGYIDAQVMRVAHSNAHDDLQITNNGITFDVEGGHAWFSADRFERESERITLSTGQDADGQPEVGYLNQTENFGGRFTGV